MNPSFIPPVPGDSAYRAKLLETAQNIGDFGALSKYFQSCLKDAVLNQLAEDTGIAAEYYQSIGVGYDPLDLAWTFPERNTEGEVIGIAQRLQFPRRDRNKSFVPGGKRGLTIQWPWDPYDGTSFNNPILLVEGQTDTAAGYSLSLPTVGRPSATLNPENLRYLRSLLRHKHVALIAEHDWGVGIDSVRAAAAALLDCVSSVRVIIPPEGIKDLRQWCIKGLTKDQLLAEIHRTEPFKPDSRDIIGNLYKSSDKTPVLIPGKHRDGNSNTHEIGNDQFAEEVLSFLPDDVIYKRDNIVGRVIGTDGAKRFNKLSEADLRLLVDEHLRLTRLEEGGNKERRSSSDTYLNCTHDLARLALAAAEAHNGVPEIQMLTSIPLFTQHWKPAAPGFRDGLYFDAPPELAGLSPIKDIQTIQSTLADLVIDFPFACDADRQNFYGLLITPLIRWAIQGNTPMHLVMAPLERTGKTKLVEQVFGGLMLGRSGLPAMQLPNGEDEMDKRLLGILLEGQNLLNLDNIRSTIDSASLNALLTSRTYQSRLLSTNKIPRVANYTTLVGTGNNITASGEIAKRSIPIYLQPQSANPEDRQQFHHPDLPEYIQSVRSRALGCLVGMVMNWLEAGKPKGSPPLGGFEQWTNTVGGILALHGYTAWRTNERDWRRTADPFGEDQLSFVEEWWAMHNCTPVAPKTLLELAERHSLFSDLLAGKTPQGKITAFARKVLGPLDNRPFGDRIVRRHKSGNNTTYLLEKTPNAPTS